MRSTGNNLEQLRGEGGKNIRKNNQGTLTALLPSILMCSIQIEMIIYANHNSRLIFDNNFFTIKFNIVEYLE
jgi:hypothetical protein